MLMNTKPGVKRNRANLEKKTPGTVVFGWGEV